MIISNFVAFSEFINFTRIQQKHSDAITTFMQFRSFIPSSIIHIGIQNRGSKSYFCEFSGEQTIPVSEISQGLFKKLSIHNSVLSEPKIRIFIK